LLNKILYSLVALSLTLPLSAGEKSGTISGYVRSAGGAPQMGAAVEVLGTAVLGSTAMGNAMHTLKAFTDERGFYSVSGLLPGSYNIRVSAPAFLPALRERVGLRAGSGLALNITLSTLFEAIQLAPVRVGNEDDDWKWVLRSAANRPILRVLPDGTPVTVSQGNEKNTHDVKGSLSFLAGSPSQGFGSASDMSTGFSVEKSMFTSGTVALRGDVGHGMDSPDAVVRASYEHKMANGSRPQVAFTMRRFSSPDVSLHNATFQALALTTSDDVTLADVLELKFGSELQTIQFLGRMSAFRPFGSADLHLSPNTVLEYSYLTALPDRRVEKGFDSAPADFSESGPRMSIVDYAPSVERAHHHEVSLSHRVNDTSVQIAVYSDRLVNTALTGVGDVGADGDVLPDMYSGTFTLRGNDLDTHGMRMVLQRKLGADLTATMDYSYGGVLDLNSSANGMRLADARQSTVVRGRHSLAGKVSGGVPRAKTRWIASYRWVNGRALTPVDMFNDSAGEASPYLDVFFRQPLPGNGFIPAHMEAILDMRNVLAQGYVPMLGQDGRTVYLVQSARSVRGGLAFTF
jgi:hypothetical protein